MRIKLSQGDADTVAEMELTIKAGIAEMYKMTTGSRSAAEVVTTVTQAQRMLKEFAAALAEMLGVEEPARIEHDKFDGKYYLVWGEADVTRI